VAAKVKEIVQSLTKRDPEIVVVDLPDRGFRRAARGRLGDATGSHDTSFNGAVRRYWSAPGARNPLSTSRASRSELHVASSDRRVGRILRDCIVRPRGDQRFGFSGQPKAHRVELDRHRTRVTEERFDDEAFAGTAGAAERRFLRLATRGDGYRLARQAESKHLGAFREADRNGITAARREGDADAPPAARGSASDEARRCDRRCDRRRFGDPADAAVVGQAVLPPGPREMRRQRGLLGGYGPVGGAEIGLSIIVDAEAERAFGARAGHRQRGRGQAQRRDAAQRERWAQPRRLELGEYR